MNGNLKETKEIATKRRRSFTSSTVVNTYSLTTCMFLAELCLFAVVSLALQGDSKRPIKVGESTQSQLKRRSNSVLSVLKSQKPYSFSASVFPN